MKKNPILAAVALFALACCLPALQMTKETNFGIHCLAFGWLGIFAGVLGWYANVPWIIGLILAAYRKRIPAILFGVLALPLASTVFQDIGRELPADEGNVTKTAIVHLLPGAYLWFLSLAALPITAWFRKPLPAPPPFFAPQNGVPNHSL